MATQGKAITADTWTEVTDASCIFQVTSRDSLYVTEQASAPTGAPGLTCKVALYGQMYSFTADSTKLYAYSPGDNANIAFEAV